MLNEERLSRKAKVALEAGLTRATEEQTEVTPGHLLWAMGSDDFARLVLGERLEEVAEMLVQTGMLVEEPQFSVLTVQVLDSAFRAADEMHDSFVSTEHLLIGLAMTGLLPADIGEALVMAALRERRMVQPAPPVLSPLERLDVDDLVNLEAVLHRRLVGQDPAVSVVSNGLRRAFAGLADPNRPFGSFLFLGPTGVGKTELAKTVAEFIYGSESRMRRLDMSEYMERHTVAKLIGSPPGYVGYAEGGQLTNAVLEQPQSLVLLDEMEKAHPDVLNVLLSILDDGRLTDGHGVTVDFTQTIVVMTSNVGSDLYHADAEYDQTKKAVLKRLYQQFRPEFLNRIDEITVFDKLSKDDFHAIVDLQLAPVIRRMHDKGMELVVTDEARSWLADVGYNPALGARQLRREIQRHVQDALALKVLAERWEAGTTCRVETEKDGLKFVRV